MPLLLLWLFILSTLFILHGATYTLQLLDPLWELRSPGTQHLILEVWPTSFAPRHTQWSNPCFKFTVEERGLGADFCGLRPTPSCQSLAITLLFWGLAHGFSPFNTYALSILKGSHPTSVSHRTIKNTLYLNCSFWSCAKLFLSNSHCSQISLNLPEFSLG